jgi:hypothetical protein
VTSLICGAFVLYIKINSSGRLPAMPRPTLHLHHSTPDRRAGQVLHPVLAFVYPISFRENLLSHCTTVLRVLSGRRVDANYRFLPVSIVCAKV